MIFNGISKDYLRVNMELFRPPSPPIEFETVLLAGEGERVRRKKFQATDLSVPITIRSNQNIEILKADMSRWLIHDEPKKLVFKDTPNRYYRAFYKSMDLLGNKHYQKGEIIFYLPQGYRYGDEKTMNIDSTWRSFEIGGQVKTPWYTYTRFMIPQSQYKLEGSNGLDVLLNFSFMAGDILEIDYSERKVRLNGNNLAVSVSLSTVWKELIPGQMQLWASHATSMKFDERYY